MKNEIAERIKNRIEQHGTAIDIDQLCLDSIEIINFTPTISRQIQNCFNVMFLTLNHCDLVSLQFFPNLPSLIALEIVGNQLKGIDIHYITNCPNIHELALDQNRIEHIEDLAPLNNLLDLEHLEVRGNPVCSIQNYRAKIFDLIPKLKIVDCQDAFGDEDVMYGTETQSEQCNDDENSKEESQSDEEGDEDEDEEFGNNSPHKYRSS